ncbi:MAG TPA: twin-arginine translocase TatA/TatE family subunit [Acidimicrobiia bacterium]|nr:twin-arginine translocase TatA/TatE family subunit [Acidimicrobiia bacterium]
MFSVSPAEILTIALVALIVFGPKRLPEISRQAGKVLRELKQTAGELKAGLEAEYDDSVGGLDEIKGALGDVRREMRSTLDAVGGLVQPDGPRTPRNRPALSKETPPEPAAEDPSATGE